MLGAAMHARCVGSQKNRAISNYGKELREHPNLAVLIATIDENTYVRISIVKITTLC